MSWSLFVKQNRVDTAKCIDLSQFPSILNGVELSRLLGVLNGLTICTGHRDSHYVKMVQAKKGKILSPNGKIAAYVDNDCGTKTVRAAKCQVISRSVKCEACRLYQPNLRAIYNRWSKHREVDGSDTSSHTKDHYLTIPEKKARMACKADTCSRRGGKEAEGESYYCTGTG